MKGHPRTNQRRDIPATRVAAFIDRYIEANYPEWERNSNRPSEMPLGPLQQFAQEVDLSPRTIYRIRSGESVNVRFDLLDGMLSKLDREYLWHWDPEEGGFSDYYQDEVPPAAKPTPEQEKTLAVLRAKRYGKRHGIPWEDVLKERAA